MHMEQKALHLFITELRFSLLSYKSSLINLLCSPCAISLWTLRFMFLKYNIFYALWCLCFHQTIMYILLLFLVFRINMSQFYEDVASFSLCLYLCLSVSWQMALINAYNIIKSFSSYNKKKEDKKKRTNSTVAIYMIIWAFK